MARAGERDEAKIRAGIDQAEYVKKGRLTLRHRYTCNEPVLTQWILEIEAL